MNNHKSDNSGTTTESKFLENYDPGAFERLSVAVDVVLLTVDSGCLEIALLRREEHPQIGRLALPGTFLGAMESLEAAAARLLANKVGLRGIYLEQLYTFGAPDRDPRMRIVTVAYCALVNPERLVALQEGMARYGIEVPWGGETGGAVEIIDNNGSPGEVAFDHAEVIGMAVKRIRGKLNYAPIGYQLLPEAFTLRRLQQVHETILGNPVNKDSFRRRMLATGELEATGRLEQEVGHRPAELYRFIRRRAV
jgi:8-oxo-dGTP diphosphatase